MDVNAMHVRCSATICNKQLNISKNQLIDNGRYCIVNYNTQFKYTGLVNFVVQVVFQSIRSDSCTLLETLFAWWSGKSFWPCDRRVTVSCSTKLLHVSSVPFGIKVIDTNRSPSLWSIKYVSTTLRQLLIYDYCFFAH